MDRINLKADERIVLGKKVKALRKQGQTPGHVFGKGIDAESIAVDTKAFMKVLKEAGETGLINLKISDEKVKPVMIRGVQHDPYTGEILNVDFYQVNLKEKVTVPVPVVLTGEEPESVKLGEAIVLQTINELQVEALPSDLIEKFEVDIANLQAVDDAITVEQLQFDREKLTVLAEPEEIIVKLAPAVTEEMQELLEEQAAEQAAAAAEEQGEQEGTEGEKTEEAGEEGEAAEEGEKTPESPQEEQKAE